MNSGAVDSLLALLFVADGPTPIKALAEATGFTEGQVDQALVDLKVKLDNEGPIQLLCISGGYHLSTKPQFAEIVSAFLRPERRRLTRSLLEVLAIVAYQQPITLAEIDDIRGVQSDYSVRTLVERGLLQETGRKAAAGRPILYGTTSEFLHQFNLADLTDLPELQAALPFAVEG